MAASNGQVLVVDDEPDMAQCLADVLTSGRFDVTTTGTSHEALAVCREREFGAVVSDVHLRGMDGLELMSRLKGIQPHLPVILVTGHASVVSAVDAIKRGAYHYLPKPCDGVELREAVERASATHARATSGKLAAPIPSARRVSRHGNEELVGRSPPMVALQQRVALVAGSSAPVLILGETGTGKELVARAIHRRGPRAKQPFVTVNASAIPETLLESEMFGHVRGAFTGATQGHRGFFSQADGGTLLLDEIGDMPLPLQAKLLRVLQAGEIHPVGSGRVEYVDVRVIAATHRRLPELVKAGQFREDLYYRLNVITVSLPPLRKRQGDVVELANFFLERASARTAPVRTVTLRDDLKELLERRPWPGNVRELENAIERLVVLGEDTELTPKHLALIDDEPVPDELPVGVGDTTCTVDALVRRHVLATLERTNGDKPQAAKLLGIDLSTLYRWKQKWNA